MYACTYSRPMQQRVGRARYSKVKRFGPNRCAAWQTVLADIPHGSLRPTGRNRDAGRREHLGIGSQPAPDR